MKAFIIVALGLMPLSGAALAEDGPFAGQIKARQGVMHYYAINLGTLGAMAKGEAPYDAAAAKVAADALAAGANLDTSMLWPKGSDKDAHPGTAALPALWAEGADLGGKITHLREAAAAMQTAAPAGLEQLQGAMKGIGEACSACHKEFRAQE